MLNRGGGRYYEVGWETGLGAVVDARGVSVSDFDRDGDPDVVVANYRANASYFRNDFSGAHWIAVRLRGITANRDGVGSQIVAHVGASRVLKLVGTYSYAGQSSLEKLIGLGAAKRADRIVVRWPDGREEDFGPQEAGTRVTLHQGSGVTLHQGSGVTLRHAGTDRPTDRKPPSRAAPRSLVAVVIVLTLVAGGSDRARPSASPAPRPRSSRRFLTGRVTLPGLEKSERRPAWRRPSLGVPVARGSPGN